MKGHLSQLIGCFFSLSNKQIIFHSFYETPCIISNPSCQALLRGMTSQVTWQERHEEQLTGTISTGMNIEDCFLLSSIILVIFSIILLSCKVLRDLGFSPGEAKSDVLSKAGSIITLSLPPPPPRPHSRIFNNFIFRIYSDSGRDFVSVWFWILCDIYRASY